MLGRPKDPQDHPLLFHLRRTATHSEGPPGNQTKSLWIALVRRCLAFEKLHWLWRCSGKASWCLPTYHSEMPMSLSWQMLEQHNCLDGQIYADTWQEVTDLLWSVRRHFEVSFSPDAKEIFLKDSSEHCDRFASVHSAVIHSFKSRPLLVAGPGAWEYVRQGASWSIMICLHTHRVWSGNIMY